MTATSLSVPPFLCPTRVHAGGKLASVLPDLLDGASWALITSDFWRDLASSHALDSMPTQPAAVLAEVTPNPTVSEVIRLAGALPEVDVLVAVGGGSVIDAAKGAAGLNAIDGDPELFLNHLTGDAALPEGFNPQPVIAVPTTSGTGSEITRWATIWGEDCAKYSLSHPALFPRDAIMVPGLCVSMPRELTLYSGLDALSHAMESVWNARHSPLTDVLAATAIGILRADLKRVLDSPDDLELRARVQTAALLAGLVMSTTQTALAHSISYPLTARFGMPHGFACAFTLPEVARFIGNQHPDRIAVIAEAFGCPGRDLPAEMDHWFLELGLPEYLEQYARPKDIGGLECEFINPSRAANALRQADNETARDIARRSLERLSVGQSS